MRLRVIINSGAERKNRFEVTVFSKKMLEHIVRQVDAGTFAGWEYVS